MSIVLASSASCSTIRNDQTSGYFITSPGQSHPHLFDVGPSRIGARLEFVINKIMDQLERAKHNAADYEQVKPFNIMVLTNSPPSDDPAKILRFATKKLGQGLHHPNSIAIQFVQIGNDQGAEKALKKLTDDPSFVREPNALWTISDCVLSQNIADTVSFGAKFTPENLQKAVLGAMHPSIRAKVAGSSGLQCRKLFARRRSFVVFHNFS